MARSGSVNYTRTRDQIIQGAYRKIGKLGQGMTLSAWHVENANEALNLMVKAWMSQGIHLWKILDAAVFLVDSQSTYVMGSGTSAARWAATYVETELSVAAVVGNLTVTVDDDAGISTGDIIGIVLDNDSVHWTTVNGVPAANVITLTAAIAVDGAAIDQHVYAFTLRANRPLRVLAARTVLDGGNEVPIRLYTRDEYMRMPNKTTTGKPVGFYYDPKLDNGTLYVWPTPETPQDYIIITYESPIEDFDQVTNEPDFPVEWFEALQYNLGVRLAPEVGLPAQERQFLSIEAKEKLYEVLGFDQEVGSVFIRPARRRRR